MTFKLTLQEALKEALQDDGKVSKYEAKVIRELIMADGKISNDEKKFLEQALHNNQFDKEGLELLSDLLLRSHS